MTRGLEDAREAWGKAPSKVKRAVALVAGGAAVVGGVFATTGCGTAAGANAGFMACAAGKAARNINAHQLNPLHDVGKNCPDIGAAPLQGNAKAFQERLQSLGYTVLWITNDEAQAPFPGHSGACPNVNFTETYQSTQTTNPLDINFTAALVNDPPDGAPLPQNPSALELEAAERNMHCVKG